MKLLTSAFLFCILATTARADSPAEALAYMNEVSAPSIRISSDMWEYIKAAAHSKNPAQTEMKRQQLVRSVEQSILQVNQARAYKDETRYKAAILKFLNTMYSMLNQDYAKIINMEEVAEQSYDLMEAYLLARKKANEKLKQAADDLREEEKKFAADNRINLIEHESEIARNLKKAGEVMDYQNTIYLIFFRSYKQEWYLLEAARKRDVSKIEQNRLTLARYADEGLKALQSIQPYNSDNTLAASCRTALEFYKKEASEQIPVLTEYLMKDEQFAEMKKGFESKPAASRTQADVDMFNSRVGEVNALAQKQNAINAAANQERSAAIDGWNRASQAFFARHVPK